MFIKKTVPGAEQHNLLESDDFTLRLANHRDQRPAMKCSESIALIFLLCCSFFPGFLCFGKLQLVVSIILTVLAAF